MLAQTYGPDSEQTAPLDVTSTNSSLDEFNVSQNRRSRRDHLRALRAVAALRAKGRENLDQLLAVRSINAANIDVWVCVEIFMAANFERYSILSPPNFPT